MTVPGFQVLNGDRTFVDINGHPLGGGKVFFYSAGTTVPKMTFADANLVVQNPNPVPLDQAGRAVIWGQGLYRQVVQDLFGNTQWDTLTGSDPGFKDLEATQAEIGTLTVTNTLNVTGMAGPSMVQDLVVNGTLTSTGVSIINGGQHINAGPGQLYALVLTGDLQINGTDSQGATSCTGRLVSIQCGTSPAFVLDNSTNALVWAINADNDKLNIGLADGATTGNLQQNFFNIDQLGDAQISGELIVGTNILAQSGTTFTHNLTIGGQAVLHAGPSNGTSPIILPTGAYVLYVAALPT